MRNAQVSTGRDAPLGRLGHLGSHAGGGGTDRSPEMAGLGKIKVLIADASPAVTHGLRSILGAHRDVDVVAVAHGLTEAVSKAAESRPDIILVDAQMLSGRSRGVLDGLKSHRDARILAMAVHSAHINDAMAAGADDHVMKDCGRVELLGAIRALERSRWHETVE